MIHKTRKIRGSSLFITAKISEINKYDVAHFMWNKITETPLFTGIPTHVLIMLVLERMK